MATVTLELVDVTGEKPEPTGDSATLRNGNVTYQGDGVKSLLAARLKEMDPEEVFENMRGWSNAYMALRERGK